MVSSKRSAQLGVVAAGMVLVSCLGLLFAYSPRNQPVVVAVPEGHDAPSFRLKDLEGHTYDTAGLRGKAMVVFFSSVHCPTCADYHDRVADLARQYAGDPRVQFLALNQDVSDGDQQRLLEVRVFTRVLNSPFPTLLDVGGKTTTRFGAKPAQFAVVDGRGVVRYLGGFDDNRDAAKASRHYVAEQLARVLDAMPTAVAAR